MGNFFEELQNLDERTKSRVLIITTIVIYFWLGYFNSIVSSGAQPAVADANANQPTQNATAAGTLAENQPGIFTRMGNGFATMAHAFENIFQRSSNYVVKPN